MKSLLACIVATSTVASAAVIATRQTFDTSGKCLALSPKAGTQPTCGEVGTITKKAGATEFKIYSTQECAAHCYAATPHCITFMVSYPSKAPVPGNSTNPGTCTTYTKTAAAMGFKKSSKSQSTFYAASCYTYTSTDDTPLQDGNFANSGSPDADPWAGYGDISTHAGPSNSKYYGTDYASSHFADPQAAIYQSVATCPGETYQLAYEQSSIVYDGNGIFKVLANGVVLHTSTSDVGYPATEQAPLYFTAKDTTTQIEFHLDTPEGLQIEAVTDVLLSAVFHGSLPQGTIVKSA